MASAIRAFRSLGRQAFPGRLPPRAAPASAGALGVQADSPARHRGSKKNRRLGNGWLIELVELLCETYGYKMDYVLWELPAVQAGLLWRANAQRPGGLKSGTLLMDEFAWKAWGRRP